MLLVSHGGPTSYVFCALTGSSRRRHGLRPLWLHLDRRRRGRGGGRGGGNGGGGGGGRNGSGEDGRSPPRRGGGAGGGGCGYWKALVVSDHEHLKEVDAPISGPNDMVEQDAAAHGM